MGDNGKVSYYIEWLIVGVFYFEIDINLGFVIMVVFFDCEKKWFY